MEGYGHTCALLPDARVKCWGNNEHGQLGLGDTLERGDEPGEMGDALPTVDLGTGVTPVGLVSTMSSVCALLEDGRIKCWGANGGGQLGLGDTTSRGDNPGEMGDNLPFVDLGGSAIQLAGGTHHVCALRKDGRVKCWGDNTGGQLGLGDTIYRGDKPGDMGDALPTVDLGTTLPVTSIAAGDSHTCAIVSDGRVKCWGASPQGQLGLGDKVPHGNDQGGMGDALPFVDLGSGRRAVAVAAGYAYTCALLDDGRVKCWGHDPSLGIEAGDNLGDQPGEMGDTLPFVDLGTEVRSKALHISWFHACALLTDGQVKCWGSNLYGQLGRAGNGPGQMGDALPVVKLGAGEKAAALATGHENSCALLTSSRLKCWGANEHGQLGLGDTIQRGKQPGQMGDALPFVDLGTGG